MNEYTNALNDTGYSCYFFTIHSYLLLQSGFPVTIHGPPVGNGLARSSVVLCWGKIDANRFVAQSCFTIRARCSIEGTGKPVPYGAVNSNIRFSSFSETIVSTAFASSFTP